MNTSFSALDTFQTCPLKYKFQEVDKIKTPKSPEAVFGSLVHSTMKFIHDGNFILPTQKQALDHFSKNWNSEIFEDEISERIAFAQGIKIIQDYYKKNDPNKTQIVDLESRFTIKLPDKKETHLISGFIDRIDKVEDGFEIIDYKTARKLPSQELVDDNLQLLIYLLAFLDRYPDQKPENVKLSLYFLKHSTKLSTVKKVDQVENEKMKIIDLVNQIEGSSFQPRVSPLCGWCGYQKICPMWKHKFRKNQEIKDGKEKEKEKEKIIDEYIEIQNKIKTLKKRVAELGEQIQEIMKEEEAERLFSGDMIIARTSRKTWKFDEEKLKNILDEVGMWENVLKVDLAKLKKVSETLPPTLKRQVDDAKYIDGETWSLSIKKSK
ncbi:MAG: PD-(D/E)XK nuclease family protein [Candidatus Moranbacteria bacterium]|jgi:RecB family exonuclease|nr:PD-(D/E)XK nuclease family protein [Candidatus Moranbacteria bacterium]